MSGEPLVPFSSPTDFFGAFSLALSPGEFVFWGLVSIFFIWGVYTVVGTYHWLKYSHASSIAFPAIGVHLAVSFATIAYALTGAVPYL